MANLNSMNNNKVNGNNKTNSNLKGGNNMSKMDKRNGRVVVERRSMFGANGVNNTIVANDVQNLINNATISRQALANTKAIDMSNCTKPISLMQLNYNPINIIGQFTKAGTNVTTIDVDTEMDAFKAMFRNLKAQDKHVKWESIWIEGYNMFKEFNLVTGHVFTIYVVTNEEIEKFDKQVRVLDADSLTVEEAKQMQEDFRPIVRAWQESSIDVVKDKTKKFNKDYKQVINSSNVKSTIIKDGKNFIDFGAKAVFAANKNGKQVPDFKFNLEFDRYGKIVRYDNQPTDLLSKNNDVMIKAVENFNNGFEDENGVFQNGMKYTLTQSESKSLDKFVDYAVQYKELAFFIKGILNMLGNLYHGHNDSRNVSLTKEDYALLRNVIYTKASELQVDPKDVINVAISAAMSKVSMIGRNKAKNELGTIVVKADRDNYKDYSIKKIFVHEFVEAMSMAISEEYKGTKTIYLEDIDHELTRELEIGEELSIVDGAAEDESIFMDLDFTGIVRVTEEGLEYDVDVYDYEVVDALFLDETYVADVMPTKLVAARKENRESELRDKGENLNNLVEQSAITHVKIVGKDHDTVRDAVTGAVIGTAKVPFIGAESQEVSRIMTFEPSNGYQRQFLLIFA